MYDFKAYAKTLPIRLALAVVVALAATAFKECRHQSKEEPAPPAPGASQSGGLDELYRKETEMVLQDMVDRPPPTTKPTSK